MFEILSAGDPRRVVDYLSNMHKHKATYGVSGNSEDYDRMIANPNLRKKRGALIKDILVSFAEALAIVPYEAIVPYVAKKNI